MELVARNNTLGNQGDLIPIWGWEGGGWVVCILSCGVSHDTMHGSGDMSESMSCDIVLGEGGGRGGNMSCDIVLGIR